MVGPHGVAVIFHRGLVLVDARTSGKLQHTRLLPEWSIWDDEGLAEEVRLDVPRKFQ